MRTTATFAVVATFLLSAAAAADDAKESAPSTGAKSPAGSGAAGQPQEATGRTAFVPCIGRGYVPYSYPAIGSCPCGDDCCYHPWRYYCGGKPYRRQWFKTWLGAHFGKGSMLDQYPCECQFPTVGRTYTSSRPVPPKPDVVPPAPAPQKK